MKKTIISALAAIALLLGGFSPIYAAEPCNKTCQAKEQAQNGFQKIGNGVEEAAVGSYNTVKNGTVDTYNKAAKGTKKTYKKAKKETVRAYNKSKEGVKKAYNKSKNAVVHQYDKTKKGLEEIF